MLSAKTTSGLANPVATCWTCAGRDVHGDKVGVGQRAGARRCLRDRPVVAGDEDVAQSGPAGRGVPEAASIGRVLGPRPRDWRGRRGV